MRSSKSRSRSKNNRNNNNRSGVNVVNRVFDSSGPEGKVRGTPQQIIDKYNQLARDAQLSGDRVATENFQQHAEHYLRLLSEAQREQEAKREQQEQQNRERQAERDRERAERAERQERESNGGAPVQADQAGAPAESSEEGDSNLVETPEAAQDKPKPRRRSRPKKAPEADAQAPQDTQPATDAGPEAAE